MTLHELCNSALLEFESQEGKTSPCKPIMYPPGEGRSNSWGNKNSWKEEKKHCQGAREIKIFVQVNSCLHNKNINDNKTRLIVIKIILSQYTFCFVLRKFDSALCDTSRSFPLKMGPHISPNNEPSPAGPD